MEVSMPSSMGNVYELRIWLDPEYNSQVLLDKYETSFKAHNKKVISMRLGRANGSDICVDAGIDLHVPREMQIGQYTHSNKINHGVKAAMYFHGIPTAYYLYPRSSMGSKTPLRLANSVGIIDSGYRGHLIGVVDNLSENTYTIAARDRLMQICAPNLTYPIYVTLVSLLSDLGETERGNKGFGSSGRR